MSSNPSIDGGDAIMNKLMKFTDSLKAKNARLVEENARLKVQLQEAKATHSRIRRIPKKTTDSAATATPEVAPVEPTAAS